MKLLVDADAKTSTGKTQPDGSGGTVRGIDQVVEYTLNVKGEVTEMKRDNNVDGTYDYREVYTLDANGHQLEKLIDLTNDGQFDRKEVYTKEADDGLVKTHFYNLVDGQDVLTKVEDYTLNANNQRTSVKVDTLGNGTTDSITRYELDALGRVAKAYFDTNGDNQVDRSEIYTRDSHGRVIKAEFDEGNDGSINSNRTYTYDALGRQTSVLSDVDNDGNVNETTSTTYDEYGRDIFSIITTSTTATAYVNRYNEQNHKVYTSIDNGNDGIIDTERYMTYDEYNRLATQKSVNAVTGITTEIRTYLEYNANNQVIKEQYDHQGNGLSANDVLIEYERDTTWGAVVYQKETYLESGKINFIATSELNSLGAQLRTFIDYGGEGSIDRLVYGNFIGFTRQDFSDDLTSWSNQELTKIQGLNTIRLSGNQAKTEITLDAETVAKLAPSKNYLSIWGDSTDTVNLEGFTLTGKNNAGNHTYYKATVDGVEYTLQIDTVIDTVLG